MIDTIYFEEQVADHPRTLALFERFSQADRIPCNHYKEVFNPGGQNFRQQKRKPALILAKNSGRSPDLWNWRQTQFLFLAHAQLSK